MDIHCICLFCIGRESGRSPVPMVGRRVRRISKQERQAARAKLGKLQNLVIRRKTLLRYDRACKAFFLWCQLYGLALDALAPIQSALSRFIQELWEEGEPRSLAEDTCSGIMHHIEDTRGELKGAKRLLLAWRRNELPNRAPPLDRLMV